MDLLIARVDLAANIDADDIVRGLNNNDDSILVFILQMLDCAGSSELEADIIARLQERLGQLRPEAPVLAVVKP